MELESGPSRSADICVAMGTTEMHVKVLAKGFSSCAIQESQGGKGQ